MFAEHEINAGEKCGEKVAMLVLNLVQNYTAYVDKGLRLPLGWARDVYSTERISWFYSVYAVMIINVTFGDLL